MHVYYEVVEKYIHECLLQLVSKKVNAYNYFLNFTLQMTQKCSPSKLFYNIFSVTESLLNMLLFFQSTEFLL